VSIPFETIREVVAEIAKANGAQLALLFGSYARGTATNHSDIDLIFVEETDLRFLDRLGRYFDPLVECLGGGVETFVYTPEEFERMKDHGFVGQAVREGIVLYEHREA